MKLIFKGKRSRVWRASAAGAALCVALGAFVASGCNAGFLNPGFANLITGGVVPLTPGPESSFVLVRVINSTADDSIEFVVTAEREVQVDEGDQTVTQLTTETVRLITFPVGQANELGILFDCNPSITRIGLGEDLDRPFSDTGLFIGAETGGTTGFGIPANVFALTSPGVFLCGDTVIFEALTSSNSIGGIRIRPALLDFQSQRSEFIGPDTFLNARRALELQVQEED